MTRTMVWRVALDRLTAEVLATSASQQGLTAEELASLILYQAAATRVGWPGQDGKGLRLAWRDWMSGRSTGEELPFADVEPGQ